MMRIEIRAVDRRVTAGAPATAEPQFVSVFDLPDKNPRSQRLLHRVAFETKVVVAFDQHLRVDRAVRIVAGRAAFP